MVQAIIDEENENKRIDIAIAEVLKISRSQIKKAIVSGNVKLGDEIITNPKNKAKLNQIYEIELINEQPNFEPDQGELDLIFEDEDIIVVNKPAGLVVHPGAGNYNGTLMNRLIGRYELSNLGGEFRLGIVHRLDKPVSGVMVVAKNNKVHENLANQFHERIVKKEYVAITYGRPANPDGEIESYIARGADRKRMVIKSCGKYAKMKYQIENSSSIAHLCWQKIKKFSDINKSYISKIRCFPETGRMHQIRVQLAYLGCPIIGDDLYSNFKIDQIEEIFKERIALHSQKLSFLHPSTGAELSFSAPEPELFQILENYS